MEPISTFAEWMRRQRKLLHLTQAALAERVGCAVVTIKKIEQEMRLPSPEMAELLADHLAIPASQRETFLRLARAEYVENLPSPLDFPPFSPQAQAAHVTNTASGFVARDPELNQLETHLIAALNGSGRIVFITGEAGRGKTTLMTEFARRVIQRHSDSVVAIGNCDAYAGVGDPYLPFRDLLSLLSGEGELKWEAEMLALELAQRLWAMLPHFVATLIERGPDLVDVLVPGAALMQRASKHGRFEANDLKRLQSVVERSHSMHGNVVQRQIFEQATQLLRALATRQPLVLLLDDLHWIDNASAGLLFHLGQRLSGSRILILGAYRPSEVSHVHAHNMQGAEETEHLLAPIVHEFRRRHGDIEINLEHLSAERGRTFVANLLDQEPNELGQSFRESLFRRTQGDPLFTVELLRDMKARGALVRNESGQWIEGEAIQDDVLPTKIEAMITRRIGRLPAPLQEMLKVASVEGETFTAEMVARVLELGERQVVEQLSAVADRRHNFVRVEGSRRLEKQKLSHYRFGHILFQKYLYETLDEAERVYLHEAVGEVLTILYESDLDAISGQVAVHYERAGLFEQASLFQKRAGEKAQRIYAHREAIDHFYKALSLLATCADGPQKAQQELALQIALGISLVAVGGYGPPQARVAYAQT